MEPIVLHNLVSSAKIETVLSMATSRSLINKLKSKGPSTEPCGTPLTTLVQSENVPFTTTLCSVSFSQFSIQAAATRTSQTKPCVSQLNKLTCFSDGQDVQDIIRRCGKSEECGRVGTLRSNEKKIVINTTCCDTNSCDPPIPTLPPFDSEANGLTCPSCYISNSDICLQRQPLKCVGNETRCINYISKETLDKTVTTESFYGCTTENICKAGSSTKHYFFLKTSLIKTTKMDVTCNKAFSLNSPVHPPLVSLIIGLEVISALFIKEYLHLEYCILLVSLYVFT
ncbi:hypothetical protein XELAEV_18036247mg [Xenopus laevis]|uniref:UPAR/Ly6 domain-containing protein n=1 Tax=Xenopus laevis TaxID=8355 RepID=A0A974CH86_XENLA|nr:hypothetical protein XELAEV_18036247mg [Xenopus laevis]